MAADGANVEADAGRGFREQSQMAMRKGFSERGRYVRRWKVNIEEDVG